MKLSVFAVIFFIHLSVAAQNDSREIAYQVTADKFQKFYNALQFDSIYALFSPAYKKDLSFDKTKSFLSGLKDHAGKILSMQLGRQLDPYHFYKTQFEKAQFSINFSLDNDLQINWLMVMAYADGAIPVIERNTTPMQLPFNEEWTVVWGGDTKEQNYHVDHPAQKNAFDLVITDNNGRSYKGSGKRNEDYYAFGKELVAPCDGEVVLAVDGINDNIPGEMNRVYLPGNTVIIKTKNNEYLFFAHFKKHSIKVKEGEKVLKGQLLGLCGNSGNSSEPHLHFHIQNTDDMNVAAGAKCFFENILVNGQVRTDHSPVKGEKIRNR